MAKLKITDQLDALIKQLEKDADLEKQLALLQQDLENYKKEPEINTMIWKAIKEHAKDGINWRRIIEGIILTVGASVCTYLAMKGFSV